MNRVRATKAPMMVQMTSVDFLLPSEMGICEFGTNGSFIICSKIQLINVNKFVILCFINKVLSK